MSVHNVRSCARLLLFALPIAAANPAAAQTTSTWNGTTSNWSDPTIWDSNPFFPNNGNPSGSTYNAIVNGGGTITLDLPITIEQLNFASGTITGANNLTVNGGFTWSGGTLAGSGTTTVAGATTLSGPNDIAAGLILGRNLTLNGNTSWTGSDHGIQFNNGALLTIGATFTDATTTGSVLYFGGSGTGGSAVNVAFGATYLKTESGPTAFHVPFNNNGTVSVQSGTIAVGAGGTATGGNFAVASGASLQFGYAVIGASFTADSTTSFTGSGAVSTNDYRIVLNINGPFASTLSPSISGGTMNFNGDPYTFSSFTLGDGANLSTLGGAANMTINGAFTWNNGTLTGAGATTTVNGTSTIYGPTLSRNLVLNGNATWTGSYANAPLFYMMSGTGATMTVGAGATFIDTTTGGSNPITIGAGGGSAAGLSFNIAAGGAYAKTISGSITDIQIPFTNNGTLSVQAGTLSFVGGTITNLSGPSSSATLTGGTWSVANNATLTFPTGTTITTNAATITLSGANASFPALNGLAANSGALSLRGGFNFTTSGDLTNTGALDVQTGSTLTVTGNYTNNGAVTGGGTIIVNNLTFTGGTVSTGVLSASGTLTVAGATTLATGAVNIGSSSLINSPLTINTGASLGGTGSAVVSSGSTLTVNGSVSQPVTAAGMIKGSGTITNTLNIQSGGHLAPGNSPGTITVGGGLTLNGDYDWDLNGNDNTLAGGTYDRVNGNGTVTLSTAGHVNINFGAGVAFANSFWNQPHQWNILAAAGGFTNNAVPQLNVNTSSFQTLFPTGVFGLTEQASALVMNWSPNPNSLSWTGNSGGNWNNPAAWFPGVVPTGNIDTQINFDAASSSTIFNDIPGTFTLNSINFSPGAPAYSLSGNGLNFRTNSSGASPEIVQNSANGATIGTPLTLTNNLTVSGAGNLVLTGAISGAGSLTYNGAATLILGNAANNFSGGANVVAGTVQVAADSALGTGNVTASGLGNLDYTASTTTSRTFSLNNGMISVTAGQTLTLSGAQITGGYLNGPGVFATAGATFAGVTTRPSATINSSSSLDQFVNDTNGGTLNVAAAVTFTGMTNAGSGSITIGSKSSVNVADFQSYGLLNVANGSAGVATTMTNVGSTPLYFNTGSRTFVGTVGGNQLADLELNGQNAIVSGGLFVNNGHVTDNSALGVSTIIADYGALVKGAGTYDNSPVTRNGGRFQAGNSPGLATFNGRFGFGGNTPAGPIPVTSNYTWEINNATGTPGPTTSPTVSGWSLIQSVPNSQGTRLGDFYWDASPTNKLTFSMLTLQDHTTAGQDTPTGPMANFDPNSRYVWPIVTFTGNYLTQDTTDYPNGAPTNVFALDASTTFDFSGLANFTPAEIAALNTSLNSNSPLGPILGWNLFVNSPPGTGGELALEYNTVPEPGTLALMVMAILPPLIHHGHKKRRLAITFPTTL